MIVRKLLYGIQKTWVLIWVPGPGFFRTRRVGLLGCGPGPGPGLGRYNHCQTIFVFAWEIIQRFLFIFGLVVGHCWYCKKKENIQQKVILKF